MYNLDRHRDGKKVHAHAYKQLNDLEFDVIIFQATCM